MSDLRPPLPLSLKAYDPRASSVTAWMSATVNQQAVLLAERSRSRRAGPVQLLLLLMFSWTAGSHATTYGWVPRP